MNRLLANRSALTVIALISALVLAVTVNILANLWLPSSRLDLTQEKLFTLAPGSRDILRKIDEPVTLRFFFSERLGREVPTYGSYAQRVRDLLTEYQQASNGKLRLDYLDPQPFSTVEDRAVGFGLQGVPIDQGGEQVYFGLAGTNSTDDEEIIAFFQPERERFLEYDLTRLINKLSKPKQRVVGLLSSLPLDGEMTAPGQPPEPWMVMEQIRQFFQIKPLDADLAEIPADIDVLMLVHPAMLPERMRYAIDQFVLRGGHLLAFLDPMSEAAAYRARAAMMRGQPPIPPNSTLPGLLDAWGVKMDLESVVGDRRNARRVSAGGNSRMQAAEYIAWLALPQTSMNRDDAVTGELQTLNLATAGALEPLDGATTKFEPLVSSSSQTMAVPAAKVSGNPDILALLRGFKTDGKTRVLAARITGPVKSAFPDGAPKAAEGEDAKPAAPHLASSETPINVILVADTDLLEDRFWVQVQQFFGQRMAMPNANNADLVVNALDNLTGSGGLIALRSRGVSERPFTVVRDLQQDAESRFRAKEEELQTRLKETEKKLADLKKAGQEGGPAIVTPEQARDIESFRIDLLRTRAELRDVQRSLRQDIDRLQGLVRFVNIGLMPILVALLAIGLGIWRLRRRRNGAGPRAA